jgi:hypothetical protein
MLAQMSFRQLVAKWLDAKSKIGVKLFAALKVPGRDKRPERQDRIGDVSLRLRHLHLR